jgi:protein O-GlcNAc transferase
MAQLMIQQAFDLARRHQQAGRLQEAERLYRQVLSQHPAHIDSMHNLALVARRIGQNDVAVDLLRRVIALRPNLPEVHCNLGNALKDTGRFDEAIAAYRQAIALKPSLPEAHNNLANALKDQGHLDEAISAYRQAVALRPGYAEAHNNLGNALRDQGRLDEAVVAYRQAIALRPNLPEAYNNLGNALKDQGQLDEAIDAYRQAIALRPDYAEAHNNLGSALRDQGRLDEVIAACRQAIALKPDYTEAHSRLLFTLRYHAGYDAAAIAEEQRRWNRQHAQPVRRFVVPHRNDRSPDRHLRIGYVSPDFRNHVVGRNLLPLFRQHDRRQFEIIGYAQVLRPDAMTRLFQQSADGWRGIVGLSDEQVAEQIRADRIDLLVDLALHTPDNRLLVFARKPAPVQVTFAGYPGSTGLSTIDYRLSDPYLDPPGMDESIYSEQTIRLPDSFWCYDPLQDREISVNSLPALERGVVTFGCLNSLCKINDDVLALWAQVMRQVENSRLLLLAPRGSHRQRTLDRLRHERIDPGRIEFVSRQSGQAYLELYHRIDLSLDSFPYNGHTTSLDSFWMGVPVVTFVGQTSVGRAGWSQLSNLGLTELAGRTPEQFVQIAVDLAGDLPRLSELRGGLRQRMEQSPLMDAAKFARNIEAAYRQIWRTWCETVSRQ